MSFSLWTRVSSELAWNETVKFFDLKVCANQFFGYIQILTFTWKQSTVSLREECTFCKSTAWGIQSFYWCSSGFQCSSLWSARPVSWRDGATLINVKILSGCEVSNIWRCHLYWSMLLHTGKGTAWQIIVLPFLMRSSTLNVVLLEVKL